jgi:hypothetical protein
VHCAQSQHTASRDSSKSWDVSSPRLRKFRRAPQQPERRTRRIDSNEAAQMEQGAGLAAASRENAAKGSCTATDELAPSPGSDETDLAHPMTLCFLSPPCAARAVRHMRLLTSLPNRLRRRARSCDDSISTSGPRFRRVGEFPRSRRLPRCSPPA